MKATNTRLIENQDRLEGILKLAQQWGGEFVQPDSPFYNPQLQQLMSNFYGFARAYFNFICSLAGDNDDRLPASTLHRVVYNLQEEWATISSATTQRRVPEYDTCLKQADSRAEAYYNTFDGIRKPCSPIAYFEKRYEIRRTVFSHAPIVSIPLAYFNETDKWTALAHEIGHDIYWNSTGDLDIAQDHLSLRSEIVRALVETPAEIEEPFLHLQRQANLAKTWTAWLEETFADVTGTLMAGPQYVDSAIEINMERAATADELLTNDGEHPIPYLRPLISVAALRWVWERELKRAKFSPDQLNHLKACFEALEMRWYKALEGYGLGQQVVHGSIQVPLKDLIASVTTVVSTMLGGTGHQFIRTWNTVKNGQITRDYLGNLFDMSWWMSQIGNWQGNVSPPAARQGAAVPPAEFGDSSPFFNKLLDEVRARAAQLLGDEYANLPQSMQEYWVANVLLHSSLSEVDTNDPRCRRLWVVDAGNGIYSLPTAADWSQSGMVQPVFVTGDVAPFRKC